MLEILWVFPFLFLPFLYNFFRNYRFVQLYSISCLAVLVSLCLMVGRVSRLNSRHTQQLSAVWISHRMARACAVRLMIRPSRWDMHSRTYIPVIKVSLTHLPDSVNTDHSCLYPPPYHLSMSSQTFPLSISIWRHNCTAFGAIGAVIKHGSVTCPNCLNLFFPVTWLTTSSHKSSEVTFYFINHQWPCSGDVSWIDDACRFSLLLT